MPTVNFFQPGTDAAVEQQQVERQRQLAQMLLEKSQRPAQGQMVSGHYVAPSWTQGLNTALQGFASNYASKQADEKQMAMGEALRARNAKEATDFMGAINGTPGKSIQPLTPNDDEGNPMPVAQQAATPPDRAKAMAIALQSQNPMLQKTGGDMMSNQMLTQAIAQALGGGSGGATEGGAPAQGGAPGGAGAGGSQFIGNGMGQIPAGIVPLFGMGGPGKDIGEAILKARTPMALREGDLVAPDGAGGVKSLYTQPKLEAGMQPVRAPGGAVMGAEAIPGYAGGISQIQGAKANATQGAESANTMVTVDTADGPRMMTRAQALQMSGGAPQQASPAGPPPAAPMAQGAGPVNGRAIPSPMAARAGDTDRAAIYSQERNELAQRLQQAQQSGDPAAIARAQQDAVGLEKEIKSNKIPLPPMPVPGIALQDDASKKFGASIATQSAEALTASRDKAKTAADDLLAVQQARKSITAGSFQGSGAETKLAIAKFINGNVPGMNIDPEKVGNTDYLKSTLGAGVLAQAKSLGANPSNADAERINQIVGDIGKDPMAMNKILDWRETMNKRAIENHNRTVGDAEGRGMKSPFDLRVGPGGVATPAGGGFKIIGVQ